jgi:hypothetical protein
MVYTSKLSRKCLRSWKVGGLFECVIFSIFHVSGISQIWPHIIIVSGVRLSPLGYCGHYWSGHICSPITSYKYNDDWFTDYLITLQHVQTFFNIKLYVIIIINVKSRGVNCAIAQAVSHIPPWWPGLDPRSSHVGFVVHKVVLGQVFSENFGFSYQFSFYRLLHTHHLSSGAGTIGQLMADVRSGLSLAPAQETN